MITINLSSGKLVLPEFVEISGEQMYADYLKHCADFSNIDLSKERKAEYFNQHTCPMFCAMYFQKLRDGVYSENKAMVLYEELRNHKDKKIIQVYGMALCEAGSRAAEAEAETEVRMIRQARAGRKQSLRN